MTYIEEKKLRKVARVFKDLLAYPAATSARRSLVEFCSGVEDPSVEETLPEDLVGMAVEGLRSWDSRKKNSEYNDHVRKDALWRLALLSYARGKVERNRKRVIKQAGEDRTTRQGNERAFLDAVRSVLPFSGNQRAMAVEQLVNLVVNVKDGDRRPIEGAMAPEKPLDNRVFDDRYLDDSELPDDWENTWE
jgi:hypothetical protein